MSNSPIHLLNGEKPSNQVSPASNSEGAGNYLTPTRLGEPTEPDESPSSEIFQFSETQKIPYLKSIKRPRVDNSEVLDGVDRVSRSIMGCIKLAESALGPTKM